ncbi:MAG TPA: GAF domain-containing protein [Thermoanaerobaculia bacterium]|nr:GAF domain-containing protein [Thermoanaerobaculia bacterium]
MRNERVFVARRRTGAILLLLAFIGYAAGILFTMHRRGVLGISYGYDSLDHENDAEQPVQAVGPTDAELLLDEEMSVVGMRPASRASLDALRTGDYVFIRMKRDGGEYEVPLRLVSPLRNEAMRTGLTSMSVTAFVFLLVGVYCVWKQPLNRAARLLLRACAGFAASGLLFGTFLYLRFRGIDPVHSIGMFDFVLMMQACALFAVALPSLAHMVLVFPRAAEALQRHPQLPRVIYGAHVLAVSIASLPRAIHHVYHAARRTDSVVLLTSVAVIALAAIVIVQGWRLFEFGVRTWLRAAWRAPLSAAVGLVAIDAAAIWLAYAASRGHAGAIENAVDDYCGYIVFTLLVLDVVAIAVLLWRQYRNTDGIARLQTRWPLAGILGTTTAVVLINVVIAFVGIRALNELPEWHVATLMVAVFAMMFALPVSFAFAVTKYKLWRADSALTGAVAVLFSLLAVGVTQYALQEEAEARLAARFGIADDSTKWMIGLAVTLLAAIAAAVGKAVHGRFRGRRRLWEALPDALHALAKARTPHELGRAVAEQVGSALACRAALLLPSGDGVTFAAAHGDAPPLRVGRRHATYLARPAVDVLDDERAFPTRVRDTGYVLLAPVTGMGDVLGIIALAPCRRGVFRDEEVRFATQFAGEVADKIQLLRLRRERRGARGRRIEAPAAATG